MTESVRTWLMQLPGDYGNCPTVAKTVDYESALVTWGFSDDLVPSDQIITHLINKLS